MGLSIIILSIVFILIAIRRIGDIHLEIWQIMGMAALTVLLTGQISPINALKSINLEVMLFLFSMFVIGVALEESGYLSHLSYKIFKKAKNTNQLLLSILFGMGFASALLMNDTLAIIGTPVVLLLAKKHNMSPKILLIALAFSITIGSAMSPIGNPQNFLIATQGGIQNPFLTFLYYLFIPTVINLLVCFFILKIFYKDQLNTGQLVNHSQEPIKNHHLALISKFSLRLLFMLIFLKMVLVFFRSPFDLKLVYITLIASLPILLLSPRRISIIKKVDWHTLIFFASMFIVMQSVWDTGFFQSTIATLKINILSIPMIFAISVILSQFISNVPLVALYLPMLCHAGATPKEMMALAAGSTIAGNAMILGAASNVIIIQNAEKRAEETITFFEFARIGIPLTIVNILVYWGFVKIL